MLIVHIHAAMVLCHKMQSRTFLLYLKHHKHLLQS